MREGLGKFLFLAHLEGTPTRRHTGYSPALAAFWCTGCIKIVEVSMYAGFSRRTFQVRHMGYSPALAALWCTGCIKIVEVIMYAGRLGMSFLAHLEGTPTRRHTGYSPALAALWRNGAHKNC